MNFWVLIAAFVSSLFTNILALKVFFGILVFAPFVLFVAFIGLVLLGVL